MEEIFDDFAATVVDALYSLYLRMEEVEEVFDFFAAAVIGAALVVSLDGGGGGNLRFFCIFYNLLK